MSDYYFAREVVEKPLYDFPDELSDSVPSSVFTYPNKPIPLVKRFAPTEDYKITDVFLIPSLVISPYECKRAKQDNYQTIKRYKMEFSVISEDYMRSSTAFQCVDDREFLYSTNNFHPTSSENPIRWEDKNITSSMVHPISDNGDICVSKELAELVMSFDPYGVEFYPASLLTKDGEITERYILALNNIQDVVDFERSVIEVSPNSGNLIVHRLFLSPEKILNIPFHKRVVYRAEGADTAVFFAPEIYDLISNDSRFSLVRKMKKNTSTRAPKF